MCHAPLRKHFFEYEFCHGAAADIAVTDEHNAHFASPPDGILFIIA
jgi:hypothetical protein